MKKTIILSIIGVVFLYLFLIFDTRFHGPDEPIYFAYTASIVEDGDLNAVNHLDPSYPYFLPDGKIGVSQTYNLPDFHNHGGVIFWAPFYIYGKLAYFIIQKLNLLDPSEISLDSCIKCALCFSSIIFGFLTIMRLP